MLVLTRKTGEQIVIGNNVVLTVVSVGPGRVKIGVQAPPDVSVDRKEVHDRKIGETAETVVVDAEALPSAVHNRIAEKLTDAPAAAPAPAEAGIEGRLKVLRRPFARKPR